MRIAKSRVVNLFILLGCPKAAKWNNDVLIGRTATLHELFDLDMEIDNKYRQLFEKIYKASKESIAIEIIDDTNNPVEDIIKNVDTGLKMKPIEELPEGQTIKPPKSDSEVTIVPDVDETDDIETDDEPERSETTSDYVKDNVAEVPNEVEDKVENNIEDKTENEPEIVPSPQTSKKTKAVKDASTKQSGTEKVESDTEKAANLPVYKSKLGKPQQIRRPLFNFEMLGIPIGAKLYYTKDPSKFVTVCGKKTVQFEEMFGDEPVSLTNLTKRLINAPREVQPTGYWLYEGVTLKKLYYDKFSDFEKIPDTEKIKNPVIKQVSRKVPKVTNWDVFEWDMDVAAMNPVERCLVSDSLTIDDISNQTKLSTSKVTQLLSPLVRYGLVLQNDNGMFTRKVEQLTKIE